LRASRSYRSIERSCVKFPTAHRIAKRSSSRWRDHPSARAVKGSLATMRPDDLAAHIVRCTLERIPALDHAAIEDLMCGCAQPAGEHGFNLGRAVALLSGLAVPGTTINRYCASSLQTTRMAAHAIWSGEGDVFISAGVECVSRYTSGLANPPEAQNPRLRAGNGEGNPELYIAMGVTAENVADREGVTREEMDRFAVQSQARAVASRDNGFFDREIVPVTLASGEVVSRDDGPRPGTTMEVLATLKPAFRDDGRVTAGNACPLNDGAAAAVIMSASRARELAIPPIARIVATGVAALEPEYMGMGPVPASRQALARAGMTMADIDIVEINEAFAAQVIPSARALGIDPFSEKLNPHGGAIALGHPFGMTGVRILATLLNGLREKDATFGLETMCVGGGMGMAMIVERLS
jgi:acetyl-CoA C-acetyltransferase